MAVAGWLARVLGELCDHPLALTEDCRHRIILEAWQWLAAGCWLGKLPEAAGHASIGFAGLLACLLAWWFGWLVGWLVGWLAGWLIEGSVLVDWLIG